MAPLAAFCIFAGRIPFIVGVTALALFAFREFARISGLNHDRWMSAAVHGGILATGITTLLDRGFGWSQIGGLLLIALVPVLRNRKASVAGAVDPGSGGPGGGTGVSDPAGKRTGVSDPGYRLNELQSLALGMIAFVFLGWMFGRPRISRQHRECLRLSLLSDFCDGGELMSPLSPLERLFGRHPLRSEISPRKTWEGALGALAVSMALPWLLRFSFPFFGPSAIVP